ncbi:hypothetical protein [Streptomyces sp. FH025]|uniref:hypothetical protein n=1 Tax=Streptomyces sp. FH025 TaxID=2815937 RepID=UPI001A9E15A2|nr:hypothetical protein [Streptomyces sp. FH025]MBO1415159.1 hypothetical protein [Streptomyces sp. FH025]
MNAYASSDGPVGPVGPLGPYAISPAAPGVGQTFGVNPADLDAAAKAAKDTGEAMPNELKAIHEPSDAAVAALSGWRVGASLKNCTAAWEECLKNLATEIDQVSLKLGQTAAGYRDADHNNAVSLSPQAGS